MEDAEIIKQYVKEQLDEEMSHMSPQGKPSLRPPSSTFDAMEAGVQYSEVTRSEFNKGLKVSERLFALGKLYDAKKDVMRDRHNLIKKQEEDMIIQIAKDRHDPTRRTKVTDYSENRQPSRDSASSSSKNAKQSIIHNMEERFKMYQAQKESKRQALEQQITIKLDEQM